MIDIDGRKVLVFDLNPEGEKTIVMIHGLFSNLSLYFFSMGPKLAKQHRVVLYDLRSHGLSERRDEGYTLEILSSDLLALMTKMKIPSASLVGYSYGGSVALYTALHYPEKVERLVLIDAPALNEFNIEKSFKKNKDISSVIHTIANYTDATGIAVASDMAEKLHTKFRCLFENDLLLDALRAGRFFLEESPPEQLALPTLLLYGNRSPYLKTGRMLAKRIPGARLHIGRSGHNLPVRQEPWVSQHLCRFVQESGYTATGNTVPHGRETEAVAWWNRVSKAGRISRAAQGSRGAGAMARHKYSWMELHMSTDDTPHGKEKNAPCPAAGKLRAWLADGAQGRLVLAQEDFDDDRISLRALLFSGSFSERLRQHWRSFCAYVGARTPFHGSKLFWFRRAGVSIGKNVHISHDAIVDLLFPQLVTLEDRAVLGLGATVVAHVYMPEKIVIRRAVVKQRGVVGGRSTLAIATLGEGAVLGAHSYTIKSVPDGHIAAGVPATMQERKSYRPPAP